MNIKKIIKLILPNYIYQIYRNSFSVTLSQGGFYGVFDSWEKASSKSKGYSSQNILEKVLKSCLEVKELPDKFERDGVIIESKNFSYEAFSYMIRWGMENGFLNVLDLGGSLGSSYFQFKKLFPLYKSINWSVIEQLHFVSTGNQFVKNNELQFYEDLDNFIKNMNPNVALLSGFLQFIPNPIQVLQKLLDSEIKFFIIDRLPVCYEKSDIITIQYVPEAIYKASYPARIFSYNKFVSYLERFFNIIHEFNSIDGQSTLNMKPIFLKGFILEKK